MRTEDRITARRQLDKRLHKLKNSDAFARPPRGWIKAVREALGLTSAQLGKRLNVSQPRVIEIEKNEVTGKITLDSLEKAARALNCRLVYAFVPRDSLQGMVQERAHTIAMRRLKSASHTMSLENQRVNTADEKEQLTRLMSSLMEKSGSELWDDK